MTALDATSNPSNTATFAKPRPLARLLAKIFAVATTAENRFWAYTEKQEKSDTTSYDGLL